MSGFSTILDDEGNINASKLAKELKGALDFDIKYKQTDNMKKRAIRSAGSYDEFKAMVNCAHLKKLSKTEVESLSHVKKGWKKAPVNGTNTAAHGSLLEFEIQQENLQKLNLNGNAKSLVNKDKKAKTCMELERDLRRLPSDQEKFDYLSELGMKATISLLKKGADVDSIEEVLRIIVEACPQREQETESNDTPVVSSDTQDSSQNDLLILWLTKLSTLDKFDLMLRFLNKLLLDRVKDYLLNNPNSPILLKTKFGL